MRKRSGGFHCQSLQEFIEAEKQSLKCFDNHKTPLFEDIETYLTRHTDRCSATTEHEESYFFQEQHQFQAEEEEELSSEGRNTSATCITISMVCEDMGEVHSHLLHPRHIKETFDRIYKGQLEGGQEIKTEVTSHVVNIDSRQKLKKGGKVHHQKNTPRGSQKTSLKRLQPGFGSNNGCFERKRQNELQFITYYDQVQKKGKGKDGSKDLFSQQQIQTKIWLIQRQETYSPLLQTYLNLSHYVFEAHKNRSELNLVQKSIGEQDDQMLRQVETFDEMLIRISVAKSSKLAKDN